MILADTNHEPALTKDSRADWTENSDFSSRSIQRQEVLFSRREPQSVPSLSSLMPVSTGPGGSLCRWAVRQQGNLCPAETYSFVRGQRSWMTRMLGAGVSTLGPPRGRITLRRPVREEKDSFVGTDTLKSTGGNCWHTSCSLTVFKYFIFIFFKKKKKKKKSVLVTS